MKKKKPMTLTEYRMERMRENVARMESENAELRAKNNL